MGFGDAVIERLYELCKEKDNKILKTITVCRQTGGKIEEIQAFYSLYLFCYVWKFRAI